MLAAAWLEAGQRHIRLFCVSRIQHTRNRCNAPSRPFGAISQGGGTGDVHPL